MRGGVTGPPVAGGADVIYPPENAKLYDQIKFEGCIVAESPLGMEPMAKHFPKRNRIISGLSSGVVIVEATLKSGSLITARLAAEHLYVRYAGHAPDHARNKAFAQRWSIP